MIQAPVPNQVKFLIPELVAEINPLAEPTVENATGEDVVQDDIADGGVIVNAWDGRPYFRPKIHTSNRALNGTFDSDTEWTKGGGWTISGGKAHKAAPIVSQIRQEDRLIIDVVYEVIFTVSNYVAGSVTPYAGSTAGTARSANGTFTEDITAGSVGLQFLANAACDLSIDNVFYRPKSLWRVDIALLRRPKSHVDFGMVVTHNLHEVYQAACENVLRFFKNTADSLPSAALQTDKTLYGRLGLPWPFIALDGVNDVGIVADHADLDFGTGDFSVVALVMPASGLDDGATHEILSKGQAADPTLQFRKDGNDKWRFDYSTAGDGMSSGISDAVITPGQIVHLAGTADRSNAVNGTVLYVDAVAQATKGAGHEGDINNAIELSIGRGTASLFFGGHIWQILFFNRILAAAEVLAFKNGGTIPAVDRWGSQTNLVTGDDADMDTVGNWIAEGAATLTGGYDSLDPGFDKTLRIEAGDAAFEGGRLPLTGGNGAPYSAASRYAMTFNYKTVTNPNGNDHRVILSDAGLITNYIDEVVPKSPGAWATFRKEFAEEDLASGTMADIDLVRLFIASSGGDATDEVLIDNFSIKTVGCVLALESDGINSVFGKWFDKANQHHATLTGVDYWHVPDADNPAFFFQAFDSFNSRYLFTQFNELLEAGQADTRMGWIIYGQMYGFNFETGGYQASENWPGVNIGKTDVGVILAEQKFGLRPSWSVTLLAQDTAGWESIHDMLQRITGPLFPFYIIWDYSHARPVIWQVRLDPEVPLKYVTGSDPWQGITFGLKAE